MAGQICLDASVVLSILLQDQLANEANALWSHCIEQQIEIVSAPAPILRRDHISVTRKGIFGRLKPEDGEEAFRALSVLDINLAPALDLQPIARELAKRFNQRRGYDVQYLAAARYFDCECWTSDKRLANAVRSMVEVARRFSDALTKMSFLIEGRCSPV